jgi:hypothetical protein
MNALFQAVLHALKVNDLDLGQCDDERRHLGQLDEGVGRRLEQYVGPEGHALEAELAEGDVDLKVALGRLGDALGKRLKLLVELGPTLTLLLLELNLVLVAVAVLALAVARLVKGDVGRLADKLDVLGLLLANHDGRLEVDVDNDNELVVARLEEEVLDVAEQEV